MMDQQEILPDPEETSVEEDPYAYLDRQFSSENFKIEVKNLPKFYGINVRNDLGVDTVYFINLWLQEFRKLLNQKLKLNANKIKTVKRNSPYAFVCFRNNEDRDNALKALSNYKWKGKSLEAMVKLKFYLNLL